MSTYNIIYNSLIVAAFILSLIAFLNGYKRFGFISALMLTTSLVELTALYYINRNTDFTWMYHVYNVIEYTLFSLFLSGSVKSDGIKKIIWISIPAFIIIGQLISYYHYRFSGFPGLNINIEGLLLSIICVYILFNMEVIEDVSVFKNYNLWICSGIFIFFGTTFFYNGVYTKIAHLHGDRALILFGIINRPLNIILYSLIITGILCLPISRKSITQ
jgi:hypothetical protein